MRDLTSSISVKAPSSFALAFLNTYVADMARGSGGAVLPLKFTMSQLANLTLEREVLVHVNYRLLPDGEPPVLDISWEPGDTALFPRFEGRLEAAPAGLDTATLSITGSYDAPLGVVGILFDAVLGSRVAQSTIEGLLVNFRDAIEEDYARRMGFQR